MGCGYAALNLHGHFLEINAEFKQMFGYSRCALLLMNMDELWADKDAEVSWMRQVREQGVVRHYAAEMKHQNGDLVLVLLNAQYLREQQAYMLCVLWIIT